MKDKNKKYNNIKKNVHANEVVPILIFSTLLIMMIIFAVFFNYLCNCQFFLDNRFGEDRVATLYSILAKYLNI